MYKYSYCYIHQKIENFLLYMFLKKSNHWVRSLSLNYEGSDPHTLLNHVAIKDILNTSNPGISIDLKDKRLIFEM